MLGAGAASADPGPPQTYYVRYAINMDFLPPLIGEKRCVRFRPCHLAELRQFRLTLTTLERDSFGYGENGRLVIDCPGRECALQEGQDDIEFKKPKRVVHFDVDDREYPKRNQAVMRYRGELIGEVFLAY